VSVSSPVRRPRAPDGSVGDTIDSAATNRSWARSLASLGVTAALCFLLLRRVDSRELVEWLTRVDRGYFAGYAALSVAGLLVRSARYYLLIGRWVGFLPLVMVTAARNFLVDLLPARIGSLSYVVLLTRRFEAPLDPVLSSFVLTFLYDLLAMAVLLGIALALQLGRLEGALVLGGAASLIAVFVIAAFVGLAPALDWCSERLEGSPRFGAVAQRLRRVAAQVRDSGGTAMTLGLLAISVVIRLIKFAAYWVLLLGVVREHDVSAAQLPFWTVFLGIAGAEFSATLPIHGLAGFGTYETAWAIGFHRLGLSSRVAILSGFATHLLSQLWDYSVGLVGLAAALAWSRRAR
jgi:Lysylphosphatidylglycerol synthase TM region